jgi:prevent-host-death family protein
MAYAAYMRTISATKAREQLYRLIDEVAENSEPIQISGPRSEAVLISADDWRGIEETLYLLSVPGMRESLLAAKAEPIEDCTEDIEW